MATATPELDMAKRKTVSTRLPDDLVSMANVVASIEKKPASEILDDIIRGPLSRMYRQALAKAQKAAEKEEGAK